MSFPDDVMGDMRKFPHGDPMADALLEGRVLPDDAPPGYQGVAELVRLAKGPASIDEQADEASVVTAMTVAIRGTAPTINDRQGRPRMLGTLISTKVLAGVAAIVLGGGVAAAATGALPAPVQTPLSHGLSDVGISIPHPNAPASDAAGGSTTPTTSSPGPAITAANAFGLCTAYAASKSGTDTTGNAPGATSNSRAFMQLAAAAQAKGDTVTQFCADATPPSTSPTGGAGSDGPPASTPAGNTPGSPPSSTPAGNTPGSPPSSTPAGNTPGSPPSSTPAGNTPGSNGASKPQRLGSRP